jgi:hypothetical protein
MVFGVCAERKHSLRRNIPLQFFDTDGLDELCPACDVVLDEFPKLRWILRRWRFHACRDQPFLQFRPLHNANSDHGLIMPDHVLACAAPNVLDVSSHSTHPEIEIK